MPGASDIEWMQQALVLAGHAGQAGEVPVGAIIVCDGRIIGKGWNQPITVADPSAHAEIMALRDAARSLGNYRLPDCELYVTLEPCTMCVGAIVHARVRRLIYAASEPKAGVVQSRGELFAAPYFNHRVQWEGGVCAEESAAMLQAFFRARRGEKHREKHREKGKDREKVKGKR